MTRTNPNVKVVGIDVSKGHLDVSVAAGSPQRFANNPAGIASLVAWLEAQDIGRVVYEPTGGYERPLGEALVAAGLPACRVHPNRVRAYAQACGLLAKTDRLDAQVLARYGAAFDGPERRQDADEPARAELQDLLRRREQPASGGRQRVQERNRLDKGMSAGAAASTRRHLNWLDAEIAQLDAEYQALLSAHQALYQSARGGYQSIPGIGLLTAATLVAELPELGQLDHGALVALSGLAPWAKDNTIFDQSRQRGQRRIRGGRGTVRRVLYMAAQSAARHHPECGTFIKACVNAARPRKWRWWR